MSAVNLHRLNLGFHQPLTSSSYSFPRRASARSFPREPELALRRCSRRRSILPVAHAIGDDSAPISAILGETDGAFGGRSDGDESDGDGGGESFVYPSEDVDLTVNKNGSGAGGSSLDVAAQRFASAQETRRRRRIQTGVMINMALLAFLVSVLLFFDWYLWRIVRLPLGQFYFMHPFLISTALSACAGWFYVQIADMMKIHQIIGRGPESRYSKTTTPTMGGLFFIPIGIVVARSIAGQTSILVPGAAVVTLAFAAIGLLDDILGCCKSHNGGLPGWMKLSLQVAIGIGFSLWLESTNIPTPYNMKFLVPLPPPLGLVYLGKPYLVLTAFCFTSMANGVSLTDGLDGLAGGVAVCAFTGMSVAVLAICPDLAIFGVSMAGACVGFLFHNRYKASVFMGDTGSLALGGALAAMAACSGMFFPLFIASGVFFMEVLSVIVQGCSLKITKRLNGTSRRFFHHFEMCGAREPLIVAAAYFISFILALSAGYVGLVSV